MRAYISARYKSFTDRKFLERLCDVVEAAGFDSFLLPRDEMNWYEGRLKSGQLIDKIKEEIRKCDLLIVDFSQEEVDVGLEIGQAFFLGKPIVVLSSKKNISPTMQKMADVTINYTSMDDLKTKLKTVAEKVREIQKGKIKIDF